MPILPQVSLPPGMVAVPENRAKAAAFDRWLAQGGKPGRKSGKFLTGPQKGMTYDQAKQRFEGMWAGASPEIRAKYDARVKASDAMPPAAATPAKPPGQMYADQKKNRMGYYSRINGVTAAPPPASASAKKSVNPAATSGAGRGKPIGTPEERAKVSQMVAEGGDYATADMGMGGWSAGVAMRAKESIARAEDPTTVPREALKAKEDAAKIAAQKQADQKREADFKAAQQAEASRLGVSLPSPVVATPAATPPPAAPAAPIQPMGPPATAKTPATPAAPTGRPVMGDAPKGVNRLTGLPIGYVPGDALPEKFAGDKQMKDRAAASVERQKTAPVITAGAPRAIPVLQPKPPTVEQRAADEMRRQAAINANPSKVNPDDPKKFFTGRVLPLDQLNNPAKAPSSGYQVGGVGPGGGRVLSVRPAFRR